MYTVHNVYFVHCKVYSVRTAGYVHCPTAAALQSIKTKHHIYCMYTIYYIHCIVRNVNMYLWCTVQCTQFIGGAQYTVQNCSLVRYTVIKCISGALYIVRYAILVHFTLCTIFLWFPVHCTQCIYCALYSVHNVSIVHCTVYTMYLWCTVQYK